MRIVFLAAVFSLCTLFTTVASAAMLVGTVDLNAQGGAPFGLEVNNAFGEIYVANLNSRIDVYDLSFNFLRQINLTGAPPTGGRYGVVREPVSGNFYMTTHNAPTTALHIFDSSGAYISSIATPENTGLAYRPSTGTLLVAQFNPSPVVLEYSLTGALVSSFIPLRTTSAVGLAFDPVTETIFLGENHDAIQRYAIDGTPRGRTLESGPMAPNFNGVNGLGMAYDPVTERLYYAGIDDTPENGPGAVLFIYEDLLSNFVPEPSGLALSLAGLLGLTLRRRFRPVPART
jgi:DNA-binding beta-propeller fold protein YncE